MFIGPDVFKNIYKSIKTMFGFKTSDDQVESNEEQEAVLFNRGGKVRGTGSRDTVPAFLTPGEFVMTKDTTERIGASYFETLNSGNDISSAITPVNKMTLNNVAENISNMEEGAPEIISFPVPNEMNQGSDGGAQSSSSPTNDIPFIGFDNNNIHTLYASSMYGANA